MPFSLHLNLLFANSLSLEESKICCLAEYKRGRGKGEGEKGGRGGRGKGWEGGQGGSASFCGQV